MTSDAVHRLSAALSDRYAVEREVGRGGMATVYLAHDLKHDRNVALKVLHAEVAATLGAERFLREIQIAARLQHPHILPLYDSGQADSLLYYVMPFVEGESLRDRMVREKQFPVVDAVRIGQDVAAALDYAHRHGVIHRDIKPENVMLHEGEAIVTDFGIAKAVSVAGGESLTQIGMAVGTPAYMSPEQASGEREPDGRSDVYSLGCVLYEMLTGAAPFAGSTVQALITKRFIEPAPAVRDTRAGVPVELDLVVGKTLARDPDERYATAAHLVQALSSPQIMTPPNATPLITPMVTAKKSIAVLPFVNMSNDPENEYFTDGIAEEIMNALSKIQALQVASRTSAFAFKGQKQDIRTIGEQLGVSTVLEGSARKMGNRLRVSAQLVSVTEGFQLWSERYDREMEDVFAIQDEIAANIVKALRVVLSENEKKAIEKAPTDNVEAYDCYLRGRKYFHQWRKRTTLFARRMFERAIELDPNFALAYAGIADCCSFTYSYWLASPEHLAEADAASLRAVQIDPDLAEARTSRGLALTFAQRYGEAEQEFQVAIRLNPKLFEAHYFYARAKLQQGQFAEAATLFQEACRLRPGDYQAYSFLSQAYDGLGLTVESEATHRHTLQLVERHIELNPDDSRALNLGAIELVHAGRVELGLEWAKLALTLDPDDSQMLYNTACFYAVQGMLDDALSCLEKAVSLGWGHREWMENDPDFHALRGDPRFEKLLKSAG